MHSHERVIYEINIYVFPHRSMIRIRDEHRKFDGVNILVGFEDGSRKTSTRKENQVMNYKKDACVSN